MGTGNFATTFVTIIHVLLCVFMIFVILLQPGKDAGMGAAFGGGAATSAFGGRGAVTFLSKITAACATLFFITSLGLSFAGLKSSVASGAPKPGVSADAGTPGGAGAGAGAGAPAGGADGVQKPAAGASEEKKPEGAADKAEKAPQPAPPAAPKQ